MTDRNVADAGAPTNRADIARLGEDRFRLLVESVQDYAIFLLDTQGRVVTWNAGAQRIKGYEAHEIIGRSFETFYPDEAIGAGWPQQELRAARRHGRFEDEGWRLRKDGSRFWASVVITALHDGHGALVGFAKVTRDLTERRRHEEDLRRGEEQVRLLIDAVKDYAMFLVDPQGRIQTWNMGAAALTGYDAGDVRDRDFSMFYTSTEVSAGEPARDLARALDDGRSERERWHLRKDHTMFWAGTVLTPVFDPSGGLRGYALVVRDLTDPKRLLELEHSNRRMSEFLAMLAHELRNPLAPIRNAVNLLSLHTAFPQQLTGVRDVIDRQLGQLTRLVDDLLDIGRIATGKIRLDRRRLDYREVVQSSVDATLPLAQAHEQRLSLSLPEAPIPMVGDATRLAQSLQNLLNNAVRYTPQGGEIRVEVHRDGPDSVTQVADSGRGIPRHEIERIFELFSQVDADDAPAAQGLGIGLSLARTLVEQHGGTLSAASPGRGLGSVFTMRLPIHAAVSPAAAEQGELPSQVPIANRVLVIDDNRDSADTMVQVLQLLGQKGRAAYGAEDGIRVAKSFRPRIVLLDLNMPDGDGFTVMRRLREQSSEFLYVAAMTGYGQASDRRRTLDAGFQAHLTKPVSADRLQEVLAKAAAPDRAATRWSA
ncbi:MAG: PAS domain S-box protein [Burkholderiaceae bacterium]|jgi:PAS domain S-box-containing protein|nr:PAS domain S-box protein [Burkholderiaceae bacterium]